MTSKVRKVLIGIALIGGIVAVAMALRLPSVLLGRARLRFPYLTGKLEPSAYQAMAERPGWSATSLAVTPVIRLRGLIRRPKSATAPWLLFYPGNDADQLANGQALLTRVAGETDYGLAVYAYRGYDSSEGIPRVDDLASDAALIFEHLCKTENIPAQRLNVVAFSIGGYLAVRAVGSEAGRGRRPATLSLLASVNDIVMVRRSPWQKLDAGDDFETSPFLAAVPGPVLVVQGDADEALHGAGQGRAISAALAQRAKYIELAGAGHVALLENADAVREVQAFIAQHRE